MAVGYGKYIIEFGTIQINQNSYVFERIANDAYCYIDYTDANYPYDGSYTRDIEITLYYDTEEMYD